MRANDGEARKQIMVLQRHANGAFTNDEIGIVELSRPTLCLYLQFLRDNGAPSQLRHVRTTRTSMLGCSHVSLAAGLR